MLPSAEAASKICRCYLKTPPFPARGRERIFPSLTQTTHAAFSLPHFFGGKKIGRGARERERQQMNGIISTACGKSCHVRLFMCEIELKKIPNAFFDTVKHFSTPYSSFLRRELQ